MKKHSLTLIATLAVIAASCSLNQEVVLSSEGQQTIVAAVENATRADIATDDDVTFVQKWGENDAISVFDGNLNVRYELTSGSGTTTAIFSGNALGTNPVCYAVYPYDESNAIAGDAINVTYPASVNYAGKPTVGGNIMVAKSTTTSFSFKNAASYLKVTLSASAETEVTSVDISAAGLEKISGPAKVTFDADGVPVVEMKSEGTNKISIKCDKTLTLNSTPTILYVALPPVSLSKGLKIIVHSASGAQNVRVSSTAVLTRSNMTKFPEIKFTENFALLAAGETFNAAIKALVTGNAEATPSTADTTLKKIVFKTGQDMTGVTGTDVSLFSDKSAIASYAEGIVTVATAAAEFSLDEDCKAMFRNFRAMEHIEGIENLNAAFTTSFWSMFNNCQSLQEIDMSNLDISKITTMSYMFYNCQQLKEVDLSHYSNDVITTMSYIFQACKSLERVNLSTITTANCTSNAYMFEGTSKMQEIRFHNDFKLSSASPSGMWASKTTDRSTWCGGESATGLTIYCSQTTADALSQTTLRYAGNAGVVTFKDYNENTLSVTWKEN